MSEKMLVTQALDERDLLVKKTADKFLSGADCVVLVRMTEKQTLKESFRTSSDTSTVSVFGSVT